MRYMDRSRFWACDFWALLVILTCSCLLRTASGDPRTAVAPSGSSSSDANHEKNLAWEQRIDIVQGVAEELSYLRKESKTHTRGGRKLASASCTSSPWYGYCLDEYLMVKAMATTDVFSFGVQVFEIMTGELRMGWKQLRFEVWRHLEDNTLEEIVHERIYMDYRMEYIRHVMHIVLLCTEPNWVNRPTMATVVELLPLQQGPY